MQDAYRVFVGSLNREAPYFQGARGVGLSVYSFDEETLEMRKLAETGDVDNPTFLSVTPDGSHVYANSEVFTWREGVVSAYHFDRQTGTLSYINKQPTLGSITAHNTVTRDGTKLLVANYGMGEGGPDRSVVVYGLRDDGGLTAPLSSVAHSGTGPDAARQERPHAHSVTETIAGGVAIVADLGIDRLVSYRIGPDGGLTRLAESGTCARRRSTSRGAASGRVLRVRHERTGFDGRLACAGRSVRQAHRDRHEAGRAGRGARRQSLRRHPDLARRPLPLWLQPRP